MRQRETKRHTERQRQTDRHTQRNRKKKLHIGKHFDTFPFIRECEDSYELSLVHNSIN